MLIIYVQVQNRRMYILQRKEKIAIFGAGYCGRQALTEYGKDRVTCFIDNNISSGSEVAGVKVVGLMDFLEITQGETVLIAVTRDVKLISNQLNAVGITKIKPYLVKRETYFPTDILVYNQYENDNVNRSEEEWITEQEQLSSRKYIREAVDIIPGEIPLFDHVEVETYNRCNGGCSFCPVSKQNDSRPEKKMSRQLFEKIMDELAEIDYKGRLALFSNNEPFLDDRIVEFHKYAREKLPNAKMHLFTNGTLLTIETFKQIITYLDELIIDNYSQNLTMIPSVKAIEKYCIDNPEFIKKVTIVLRKQQEILTTRGGEAPNRKILTDYSGDSCLLVFRQMIIRPDGKVSLCCSDPLGKNTLGNLNESTLCAIWNGEKFRQVREQIKKGRGSIAQCKYCDLFNVN